MLKPLSSPILFVAPDVVKDLDGGDALCRLSTLFAKCRTALEDGRRLENISWRLWHCEMFGPRWYCPMTPHSAMSFSSDSSIGRSSCDDQSETDRSTTSEGDLSHLIVYHSPAPSSVGSSGKMPATPLHENVQGFKLPLRYQKPNRPVGKIICDVLPRSTLANTSACDKARPCLKPPSGAVQHHSSLLPTVQIPSVASSATSFPRVIVVNPTPNPTPHPTPPATPTLLNGNVPSQSQPLSPTAPEHLIPPQPVIATSLSSSPSLQPMSPPSKNLVKIIPPFNDETLKPSDRRSFLRYPEDHPSEGDSSREPAKSLSMRTEKSSASGSGSSGQHGDSIGSGLPAPKSRKGKEAVRHHPSRGAAHKPGTHATRPVHHRSLSEQKPRPAFNIGSLSSTGSKSTSTTASNQAHSLAASSKLPLSKSSSRAGALIGSNKTNTNARAPTSPPPSATPHTRNPPPEFPPPTGLQRRRIVVASTSSEYETTDAESDSWESEDVSEGEDDHDEKNDKQEVSREEIQLREAALEAQRQRELFAKVPKRSYSNLARTQSVGLLSALLNPDPNIFPPNHPYRTSYSSHDLQGLRPKGRPLPKLQASRTEPAAPLAAQMTNISAQTPIISVRGNEANPAYQTKKKPQGQDVEYDSDTGDDNPHDGIQVSRSVAQQKLAALADRRKSNRGPNTMIAAPSQRPILTTVATAPIPFTHPYNLPAPEAPMTPRTTRRQMLSTELSESLRRNLLWARQVSKTSMMGGVRRQSAGGVLGGGLRPLTAMTDNSRNEGDQHADVTAERDSLSERRRAAMARNRSWADDYHCTGW